MNASTVYVKTDDQSRIIAIDGGYTKPSDLTGWTPIDEGFGDKYNLCQTHYLPKPLYTLDGIPQYKLVDNIVTERTVEEIAADQSSLPPVPPTSEQRLDALEAAMLTLMLGGAANE